jgi:hypothetical protein
MLVAHNARPMATSFRVLATLAGRDIGDTIVDETRQAVFVILYVANSCYLFLSIITPFTGRSAMFSTLNLSIHVRPHRFNFLADPSPTIPAMVYYAVGVPSKLSNGNKTTHAWGKMVLNERWG